MKDSYKTLAKPSMEVLYKDRSSKFFATAFPVSNVEDVKEALELLKKQHHLARHFCYAYQLGSSYDTYRVNDDGEPSNSAGQPIYGQIQAYNLTNTLVVVVRYFGGTKLGVGGLIQAYKTAASLTLEQASIIENTIDVVFKIEFTYDMLNKVMRAVKEYDLKIVNQQDSLECKMTLAVRTSHAEKVQSVFSNMYPVLVRWDNSED